MYSSCNFLNILVIMIGDQQTRGKKRAEKTLGATYAKAIASIIDSLPGKNDLRFCRWDLNTHMYSRRYSYYYRI